MSARKSQAGRTAAVLTTSEVAANAVDLERGFNGALSADISFTKGSLTNGIFRFYVSNDQTTWVPLAVGYDGTSEVSRTYTADQDISVPVFAPGWKFFRVSVQGTGTVTSSSATVNYRLLARGTQM